MQRLLWLSFAVALVQNPFALSAALRGRENGEPNPLLNMPAQFEDRPYNDIGISKTGDHFKLSVKPNSKWSTWEDKVSYRSAQAVSSLHSVTRNFKADVYLTIENGPGRGGVDQQSLESPDESEAEEILASPESIIPEPSRFPYAEAEQEHFKNFPWPLLVVAGTEKGTEEAVLVQSSTEIDSVDSLPSAEDEVEQSPSIAPSYVPEMSATPSPIPTILLEFVPAQTDSIFPSLEPNIYSDALQPSYDPNAFSNATPPALPSSAQPHHTTEEQVVATLPLTISSESTSNFARSIDSSIRIFAANWTQSSVDDWWLADLSDFDERSSGMRRRILHEWYALYHGQLPKEKAKMRLPLLKDKVQNGALTEYLTDVTGEKITADLGDEHKVDVNNSPEASAEKAQNEPAIVSNAEEEAKEEPQEGATGTEESEEKPSTNNHNNESHDENKVRKRKSVPIILGSCFGGLAVLIAALLGVVQCRRGRNQSDHLIDGEPAVPSTITSVQSSTNSSRFETGAPVHPRGPEFLREQSRILDWQLDHANVTGHVTDQTAHEEWLSDSSSDYRYELSIADTSPDVSVADTTQGETVKTIATVTTAKPVD